jgi:hypothetical protein
VPLCRDIILCCAVTICCRNRIENRETQSHIYQELSQILSGNEVYYTHS